MQCNSSNRQLYSSLSTLFWGVIFLVDWLNDKSVVTAIPLEGVQSEPKDALIFVQAVWRHGDRSPTTTWKNDPYQEDTWPQGWGQLTTVGMAQHVALGKRLREKYVDTEGLVSKTYKNHEIYLRSTDVNRTLTSAISNMIGFYGEGAISGVDYPPDDWPEKFIPIAVHTVDHHKDHVGNADPYCPRRIKILDLWKETPEYKQLMEDKKWVFDNLTKLCGEEIELNNFWIVADAIYIENLWKAKLNLSLPGWATQDFINEINQINWKLANWGVGRMQPYNGLDFSIELPKMRGGGLLWALIDQMHDKVNCMNDFEEAKTIDDLSPLCQWMYKLKYYVFSVHDTTIASLFATLGFNKTNYDTDGYPHYSACVTVELWQKPNKSLYVKVLYWEPNNSTVKDMTTHITGCESDCTLKQFTYRSLPYKAKPNPEEYCNNLDLGLNSLPLATTSSAFVITCFGSIWLIGLALLTISIKI